MKKEYINPATDVLCVETQQMLATSSMGLDGSFMDTDHADSRIQELLIGDFEGSDVLKSVMQLQ